MPLDHVVRAGAGAAPPGRGLLPDAQRVELDVREIARRRADGMLAGLRGPLHQLQVRVRGAAVWDVAVRLDAEARREQVAERVKKMMASEEMRAKSAFTENQVGALPKEPYILLL